ncbi:MAG: hypothetical protein ACREDF_08130, partial [Thermoplasmata archaeon]
REATARRPRSRRYFAVIQVANGPVIDVTDRAVIQIANGPVIDVAGLSIVVFVGEKASHRRRYGRQGKNACGEEGHQRDDRYRGFHSSPPGRVALGSLWAKGLNNVS